MNSISSRSSIYSRRSERPGKVRPSWWTAALGALFIAAPVPSSAAEVARPDSLVSRASALHPVDRASALHSVERGSKLYHIPAFSRQYRTACSTCHTAAPKLNVLGEVFRISGYRMPENQLLLREDDPVSLGDEAWKDQWPRAIWPGDVPGQVPLAVRIQTDLTATRDESVAYNWTLRAPHEVYLLAGTNLGGSIGLFLESQWSREEGLQMVQAKFGFQDPIPGLPAGSTNFWFGLQNPYLFTFADRQIDRAARQQFEWQNFRASNLRFSDPSTGADLVSRNAFQLGWTQPSLELNGVISRRFYYGVGVAQGAAALTEDNNPEKDLYYKLRYKFGGLDLTGQYDPGGAPVVGSGGQLLDRSITIETFGYFGSYPAAGGIEDEHRSFGLAVRALDGPFDVGIGVVRTHHSRPWGVESVGTLSNSAAFGKLEYMVYPWLFGSLKGETFSAPIPDDLAVTGFALGAFERDRIMPGIVLLLRQNVRGVFELELFSKDTESAELGRRRPHALWARFDVAF